MDDPRRLSDSAAVPNTGPGHVVRGLPHDLSNFAPVTIGSDPGCDIVIKGADPIHARLRWNAAAQAWFVNDDPAPGSTLVNKAIVGDEWRLEERDTIEVAGVRIRFSGGWLKELEPEQCVGLRVTLTDVAAEAADGRTILDGVTFQSRPGSFTALVAPSGCGKTMLVQRLAGLAPYHGDIRFNGHPLWANRARLQPLIAYLPQSVEDSLHADMSVEEAMRDFARSHLANADCDFPAALCEVALDWHQLRDTAVGKVSGGQRRRLALALALLRDPQLLLLDEPTAGLDPQSASEIAALLRRFADQGRTVICASHDTAVFDRCDDALFLARGGRQAFFGTPEAAFSFFGLMDWPAVYRELDSLSAPSSPPVGYRDPEPRQCPKPPPRASFGAAFRATLWRLVRSRILKPTSLSFFGVTLPWRLPFDGMFVGMPLLVALVLLVACRSMFPDKDRIETVFFCMVIAMFWIGMSGTVRSLVSERVPKRCLDRMRGLPLGTYFASHVVFGIVASAVQSLLFLIPVFVIQHSHLGPPETLFSFCLVLFMVGCMGGWAGLAVSALCRSEMKAVQALPCVAILALFLSKPVLGYEADKKPEWRALRYVECLMPTLYPQTLLDEIVTRDARHVQNANVASARWDFLSIVLGYLIVLLPCAYHLQRRNELDWDGR